MEHNYDPVIKQLAELTNALSEKRHAWFQHIQLLASSLFGVIIALHSTNASCQWYRYLFALGLALLALGLILNSISIYSQIAYTNRARKALKEEAQKAIRSLRAIDGVTVPASKLFAIAEIGAYICFLLSVVLLACYSILDTI
jgi:hypothetical protein